MDKNISVRIKAQYWTDNDPETVKSALTLEYNKLDYNDLVMIESKLVNLLNELQGEGTKKAKEKSGEVTTQPSTPKKGF